ncbi:Carboxyl-terminal-processing peptidase [Seminavis robusta]|uniref:Carboxyl-terminal-processing peptidase n=1 Tax=Seminavis robusta TaxID=568900 RepID=A0A9N8E6X8_9STRA|nr:Carboxyl-terminal-processing peptidase [Seminavis robusta]|eukprot:Sro729_g193890.1 Carboxyl-terminal-processing peptidase (887) ;mRNA; r:40657-43537
MKLPLHLVLGACVAVPNASAFQPCPASSLVGRVGPTRLIKESVVALHCQHHEDQESQQRATSPMTPAEDNGTMISHSFTTALAGILFVVSTCFSVPALADGGLMVVSESSPQQTTANVRAGLSARRYWNIMASQEENSQEMKMQANEGLIDHAVGTVNTMYYDNTGGVRFTPREFYNSWRALREEARQEQALVSREATVQKLKSLISSLNDPYSKYLTREELWQELKIRNDGFLGIGAVVEAPDQGDQFFARGSSPTLATVVDGGSSHVKNNNNKQPQSASSKKETPPPLSATVVQNLPVVTAVVPDSPAERSGITVGDRVVAVGDYTFLGLSRNDVNQNFQTRFTVDAADGYYFGHSDLTLAKPLVRTLLADPLQQSVGMSSSSSQTMAKDREVIIGYRQTRVRLPTKSLEEETFSATTSSEPVPQQQQAATTNYVASGISGMESADSTPAVQPQSASPPPTKGGNSIVHWELISGQSQQPSIFQRSLMTDEERNAAEERKVGYIRLTRFSRASTAGYIEAVQALEDLGATSFIIDVRNNYGGIIQEAMLTASTLLRDPHAVLCYTMNSRGGFAPHDVEEYVVDKRYPGYMMSSEPRWVTLRQSQRDNPELYLDNGSGWVPPSSYASLREQTATRGLHRPSTFSAYESGDTSVADAATSLPFNLQWNTAAANAYLNHNQQWLAQRNLVILINEGTASSAEVFASSLHDNGRTLALIGTKSYGKGLIQHTFPMPDGGGLRLTVAEYLTPALRHVTVVGNAKFDRTTGEQVGGGITPDVYCASKQGIPANIGADLCVGMALDVLDEAEPASYASEGHEKHHRQQHLKERQQQEDFTKKGILVLGSQPTANDGAASTLETASFRVNDKIMTEKAVNAHSSDYPQNGGL